MRTYGAVIGAWLLVSPAAIAAVWHVSGGDGASDGNDGSAEQPFSSVVKAVSMAQPGDTVVFSPGTYACSRVQIPDGTPGYAITLRGDGTGKVILANDGRTDILRAGSWNTFDGIEFQMTSDQPSGTGLRVSAKEHVVIRNCRFFACHIGVYLLSAHYVTVQNSEMAYSGAIGLLATGSGQGPAGHLDPNKQSRQVEVRNCYLHDAGWNVNGTEGYGINVNGAAENVTIENCQIDNNSGDGILYEDWTVHSTARYNVIRGTGIAAIWMDNASMAIFENNYLEANNVAVWLSGEESSNRYLSDFVAIRNNIVVHNDWSAIDASVYGKVIFLITSTTRDTYFDQNTVAFNNCQRVVGVQNRPPQNLFRNVWFRNNIFWQNTGTVAADAGVPFDQFHFTNNLWDNPYDGDAEGKTGDPMFEDPGAHGPEGYRIQAESTARDQGMLLYEVPPDFWNGARPHLSQTERYDIGAHEYGSAGTAKIGLDLTAFPFEVPPYELRFRARPPR